MILKRGYKMVSETYKILKTVVPNLEFKGLENRFEGKPREIAVKILQFSSLSLEPIIIDDPLQKVVVRFNSLLDLKDGLLITTKKLYKMYGEFFQDKILILSDGEMVKSKSYLFKVYDFLLENNASNVKIFGGGSLTDLASFAASTFKRGIEFCLYPTTLLAQIDACIGGKSAINYSGVKNLIGTINFAKEVVVDPTILISLNNIQYLNGLVEALKISIITGNMNIFDDLSLIKQRRLEVLTNLIVQSIRAKLKIVNEDVNDKGIRRVLNFGHTFGHIFEIQTRFGHGLSVLWGMQKESLFLYELGLIDKNFYERLLDLFYKLKDPQFFSLKLANFDERSLLNDKKAVDGFVYMPVIKDFGIFEIKKFNSKIIKNFIAKELC